MAPREAWQLVPNVQAGVPPSKLLWTFFCELQ